MIRSTPMAKRSFLPIATACVLNQALSGDAKALPPGRGHESTTRVSQVLPLNTRWLWSKVPAGGDAYSPDLDDSAFTPVTLPHINAFVPWHAIDQRSYQFVSLYQRYFEMPEGPADRHVFVDFAGSMTAAEVSLHGVALGDYFGGFTPFSFELTRHLRLGKNGHPPDSWRG